MARPKKKTIDYFPHIVLQGKTLFILESNYGNDGYAFWFKVLELLGSTDGMFYDCNNASNWGFLLAKTRVNEETANNILNTLSDLEAIDQELWREKRIIWSQNLVDNVKDAFSRRIDDMPQKPFMHTENPSEDSLCEQKPSLKDVSVNINRESKVKESKLNKSKEKESKVKESIRGKKFIPPTYEQVKDYCFERGNNVDAEKFIDFYSSKGWMVGKNKMKDWKAAVRTWERGDNTPNKKQGRLDWIDDI